MLTQSLHAQSWTQTDDFPGTARDDGAAFGIGQVAYFGTGLEVGWQPTRDFYAYSLAQGWQSVASLPEGMERQYACGCAAEGFGYVFGGVGLNNTYFTDLWRYTPDADTWEAMEPLPGPGRSGMACFAMGGKLYFVGGRFSANEFTAETWRYDPALAQWEQVGDYPGGSVWRMQAGLDGTAGDQAAFVSTGLREDGSFHDDVYAYLEAPDGWSNSLGNLPGGGRMYASMGRWLGSAVLFAGEDAEGNLLNDLWRWNWSGLQWEAQNPLPDFPRRGGMMTHLGNQLIYTCGLNPDLERIRDTWSTDISVNTTDDAGSNKPLLYPNPGSDVLYFNHGPEGLVSARFFSLDGKLCHAQSPSVTGSIAVGHLPKGMYIVELRNARGETWREKWVKQ